MIFSDDVRPRWTCASGGVLLVSKVEIEYFYFFKFALQNKKKKERIFVILII